MSRNECVMFLPTIDWPRALHCCVFAAMRQSLVVAGIPYWPAVQWHLRLALAREFRLRVVAAAVGLEVPVAAFAVGGEAYAVVVDAVAPNGPTLAPSFA